MKAHKSYYVSATAVIIENRNKVYETANWTLHDTRYVQYITAPVDQCNSVHLILSPRTVITDFEKAAMNAVSTIFPNAQRRGCRFHLGQSWWRRIQSLGMSEDYKDKNSEKNLLFYNIV